MSQVMETMSNYYMWMLRAEKLDGVGIPVVDPRIRYYFYRQTEDASVQDENIFLSFSQILLIQLQDLHIMLM